MTEDRNSHKGHVVSIQGAEVARIEYRGEPVVTFAMVDKVHQRPDGTAGRNFRDNRDRFAEGEDYVELTADEIRRQSLQTVFPPRTAKGVVLTRRGYLKLTKPMNDDRAWAVQGEMIDRYFAIEATPVPLTAEALMANPLQLLALTQGYALRIVDLERDMAVMQQDVEVLDRFGRAEDWFGTRRSAKILNIPERKFTDWLIRNGWAYRPVGNKGLLGYADKQKRGYVKNAPYTYTRPDGTEGVRDQLVFSMAGIVRIAKLLNITLMAEQEAA